jgi:hypothetical protein
MGKSEQLVAIILLFLLSLTTNPATACTIFTATHEETVLFAGNEDQRPNDAYFIVDTSGTYGVVYIATPWDQWPMVEQTGINEQGLSYDTNWIPRETLNPHPDRGNLGEWAVTYLMKESATVEEVLETIFTFDWGDSISYQVHFADATGDAAVVHPGPDGELTYTRKQEGDGYLLSTNFNLVKLGSGEYSCSRFETANGMLSGMETEGDLTVDFMASILDATHQEGEVSTIYSMVYDLRERLVYLYYEHSFDEAVTLDVAVELLKGDRQTPLEDLLPASVSSEDGTIVSQLLSQPLAVILMLGGLVAAGSFLYHSRKA